MLQLRRHTINSAQRLRVSTGTSSTIPLNADVKVIKAKKAVPFCRRWKNTSSDVPFYGEPRPLSESSSFGNQHTVPLLGPLQRIGVALHSATTALSNPERADAVAALGEITGHVALSSMYDRMMSDSTGRRILRDRPLVDQKHVDLNALAALRTEDGKEGTSFGQAYAAFMENHGFDPDDRSKVKYIADPQLAYIMLRYRQCHDFWHTLTGLPPTVLGELGLKWLELIQTGLPVAALSATVGSLRLNEEERHILNNVYLPWAVRVGKNATFLMNVYYEEEFATDLCVLRERLGIETVPSDL